MKIVKKLVSIFIVVAMVFAFASCTSRGKCKALGETYMDALISQDYKTLKEYSRFHNKAETFLGSYTEDDVVEVLLSEVSYELEDVTISSREGTGLLTYEVTLPDLDAATKDAPDTIEEFETMVKDDVFGTTTMLLEISVYKVEDEWKVNDHESVISAFYDDFYKCANDIGYVNFNVDKASSEWEGADGDTYEAFSTSIVYYFSLDEVPNSEIIWSITYNDEEICSDQIMVDTDRFSIGYEVDDTPYLTSGTYKLVVTDTHSRVLFEAECLVDDIDYGSIIESAKWVDADGAEYSADATMIQIDVQLTTSIYMDVTVNWYFNDELISTTCVETYDYISSGVFATDNYMYPGIYRAEFYDENDTFMYLFECEVKQDKLVVMVDEWDTFLNWYHTADDVTGHAYLKFNQDVNENLTYEIYFEDKILVYTGSVEATDEAEIVFDIQDLWSSDIYYDHFYAIHVYGEDGTEYYFHEFFIEWNG